MILPACEFFLKSESSFFTRFSTSRHSYGSLVLLGEPFSLLLRVFSGFPAVRNTSFRFFASDIRHFVRLPFRYFLLCPSFVRQFLSERSERRPLGNLTRLASLLSRRRSISGEIVYSVGRFDSFSANRRLIVSSLAQRIRTRSKRCVRTVVVHSLSIRSIEETKYRLRSLSRESRTIFF